MGKVMLNKLQVLPLPEKPQPSRVTMGCKARKIAFDEIESKSLEEFTIDPHYE